MTGQALVSIIIPVYNGGNFLREAIESALAQTWPKIEVLVVNDGSADGGETERIALSYGDRIRYIAKENGGVATALNRGIREMRGEYFSWLSHDDVYYPEKIARQMAEMARIGREVILYSDYDEIDAASRKVGCCRSAAVPPDEFRRLLVGRGPVHGCSTLIPRVCFERVGCFDETLKTSQDYDLWFRLSRVYDFVHLPEVLVGSRTHGEQNSRTMSRTRVEEGDRLFIRMLTELAANDPGRAGTSFTAYLRDVSLVLCRSGYGEAARYAARLHGHSCSSAAGRCTLRIRLAVCLAFHSGRQLVRALLGKGRP